MTKKVKKANSKQIANWSLGVMGAGFLATLPMDHTITGRVMQGGFEAGLIGGLADWFAVTALFRHPLNIPIPHTALLPKNRDRIIKTILHVLENEWLTKESIVSKVEHIQIAEMMIEKVEKELQTDDMKEQLRKAVLYLATKVDTTPFQPQMETWAKGFMKSIKTEGIVQKAVDKALENQMEEKIYGVVLKVVDSKLSDPNTKAQIAQMITKTIEKKSENKLFGLAVKPLMNMVGGKKMAEIIDSAITELLKDLNDETSENRKKIMQYIKKEMELVKTNETVLSHIENMKQSMVDEYEMKPLFETLNLRLQTLLLDYVQKEDFVESKLFPLLLKGLDTLKKHPTALAKIDAWIKEKMVDIIEQNHQKIGQLVKDNLDKMTNDEITDLLENKLGNDITWIRVNGALCGCLIGLALTGIKLIAG